jgi:hypothetical protein
LIRKIDPQVKGGILNGFLELDEKLRKIPEVANGEDKSGTTAVCALISEKYVLFSNCGDSRGVLSGDGSKPVLATQDHKPSNPPERERIQVIDLILFLGRRPLVPFLLIGPPIFPIFLFLYTTLLTGMTGISLHVQWPLT